MTLTECKQETIRHIMNVQKYLTIFTDQLRDRGLKHDASKLNSPEVEIFTEYTPKLAACTYGSPEYKEFLKEMKPALDHHYSENRHHPEYFPGGVNNMTLVDIVEMLCDWKAATLRHDNGDLIDSINYKAKRFHISDQLVDIMMNTANMLYVYEVHLDSGDYSATYLSDDINLLYEKIDSDNNISDDIKKILKYGPNDEFVDGKITDLVITNGTNGLRWYHH